MNAFVLGSELYHDYYRWPRRDRTTFEQWKGSTEWGKLFTQYALGEGGGIGPAAAATGGGCAAECGCGGNGSSAK